jgi:hypothetical protein
MPSPLEDNIYMRRHRRQRAPGLRSAPGDDLPPFSMVNPF